MYLSERLYRFREDTLVYSRNSAIIQTCFAGQVKDLRHFYDCSQCSQCSKLINWQDHTTKQSGGGFLGVFFLPSEAHADFRYFC